MIHTIEDIIDHFAERQDLAIDYFGAPESQILELAEILEDNTSARPHDDQTYAEHMLEYRYQYRFLTCDGDVVSSYAPRSEDCREFIVTIGDVLDIAGCKDVAVEQYSESDFDSVF